MPKPNWKHDPLSGCVPHIYEQSSYNDKWLRPLCNHNTLQKKIDVKVPDEQAMKRACKRCQKIWEKKRRGELFSP